MMTRRSFDRHVLERRFGLGGVPARPLAPFGHVGGGVAGGGVPEGDQAQTDQPERHGAVLRYAGSVAGLADADDLAGVGERDLDAPASGVAGYEVFGRGGEVGGDQR